MNNINRNILLGGATKKVEYFTIEALEDGLTARLSVNACEYSLDENTWNSLSANSNTPTINKGQTLSFRGNLTPSSSNGIGTFTISKKCKVKGNIMSLLYGNDFKGQNDLTRKDYAFYKLFLNCSTIVDASELVLPATKLGDYCYWSMFENCTNLITAPELPATTVSYFGYCAMFENCTNLITAPELPATTVVSHCYLSMFAACTSLTTAPELPATTLAINCYSSMFYKCTSLTEAPQLPATTLASGCYNSMFGGTNVLPDCSNIDFTNESVVTSGGLQGLFNETKVTDADLERILPKNNKGKYCLPVTTLRNYCYSNMFSGCTNLTTAPELPATILASNCYERMFSGCTSLTTAPELPATTLKLSCYENMFYGCTSLTTAPKLPATILASNCYDSMFYGCSKLNYIKMLATDISASSCLSYWVSGVSRTGTFVKHPDMTTLPTGSSGIPSGWTVEDSFTPVECRSLSITANNVSGRANKTKIYYTAELYGYDDNNNYITITKTGETVSEEFPQNTSETETVTRTISYTYMGVTATTIITQGVWINSSYTIMLNDQWQLSDKPNPNASLYDGVYESFSNKGINSKAAVMYIDINGYTDFDLYIRSYAESCCDYVMVSQLDQSINNSTSYSNTTLVKAHTWNNSKSGNTISDYTKVSFTGIDGGLHRITIVYRKDSSVNSGDDRGYILIPKN